MALRGEFDKAALRNMAESVAARDRDPVGVSLSADWNAATSEWDIVITTTDGDLVEVSLPLSFDPSGKRILESLPEDLLAEAKERRAVRKSVEGPRRVEG